MPSSNWRTAACPSVELAMVSEAVGDDVYAYVFIYVKKKNNLRKVKKILRHVIVTELI